MSHNPHWHKYPVGGRPWSAEEDQKLIEMRAAGKTSEDIGDAVDRTAGAIKCRVKFLNLPPVVRSMPKRRYIKRVEDTYITPTIPAEVLEDRIRRAMTAPRDLVAAIAGDPLPGYSALERRA